MVASVALAIGKRSLPAYAHRFAPKKFTQPQLFACLVLKTFFKTDYRGVVVFLNDMPQLGNAIGLQAVPHFTTLQKAAHRLLCFSAARQLLDASLRSMFGRKRSIKLAAIDSSGFEAGQVSPYFVKRRSRDAGKWQTTTYTRFPKLNIICDSTTHMILAAYPTRDPTPDVNQLLATLQPCAPSARIDRIIADAGYDSEANHRILREERGIKTIIPPRIGRPTSKPATGRYLRLMQKLFCNPQRVHYGQRW